MTKPQTAGAAASMSPEASVHPTSQVSAAPAPVGSIPSTTETRQALSPGKQSSYVFRPDFLSGINDPFFLAVREFHWADRQQHGRMFYNRMMQHMAVKGPVDTLVAILGAFRPQFKPSTDEPTDRQRQIARFANEQLRRLGITGDSRQGYEKFIGWIGQGLVYGFSLAEMVTSLSAWEGQARVQVERIIPIPQATLDSGWNPLEEYGYGFLPNADVRYNCFDMDAQGNIRSIRQFQNQFKPVIWQGADMMRLLHFTHKGTESNPYGESILFAAAGHFADLYQTERMDMAMLAAGQPYLGISYKTPDGRASPALHAQVIDIIKQQDPDVRAFVIPDATYTSVSPSNPAYTDQAERKKKESRSYIHQSVFGANIAGDAASATEIDTRNVLQVFFKYYLPGCLLKEIGTLLQWQFARRLIDANWSNLTADEYPTVEFQNMLDNDLRVSTPLLQQVMPFVDSSRFGEFLAKTVPGFDSTWIPSKHSSSVAIERQMPDPAGQQGSGPPSKPPGTPDTNKGTNAEGLGKDVNTDS